jgi:hypothetical protein
VGQEQERARSQPRRRRAAVRREHAPTRRGPAHGPRPVARAPAAEKREPGEPSAASVDRLHERQAVSPLSFDATICVVMTRKAAAEDVGR